MAAVERLLFMCSVWLDRFGGSTCVLEMQPPIGAANPYALRHHHARAPRASACSDSCVSTSGHLVQAQRLQPDLTAVHKRQPKKPTDENPSTAQPFVEPTRTGSERPE
jgi:hypothetical protein